MNPSIPPSTRGARGLLAVLAALFALVLTSQPAAAQLGIGGGVNFNQGEDIDVGDLEGTFDDATGYHVGLFVSLGDGPLQLRPGVFYHQLGTFDFPGDEQLEMSAIEVPIDVRLNVVPLQTVDIYLLGAPVITFPQTDGVEDAAADASLSADVGAGLEIRLPGSGISLMPELRYSFGVTEILEDGFTVGDVNVTPSDDERHIEKLVIRLNVLF